MLTVVGRNKNADSISKEDSSSNEPCISNIKEENSVSECLIDIPKTENEEAMISNTKNIEYPALVIETKHNIVKTSLRNL